MHANISILILIYYLSTVKRKFSFSRLYFITKVFNFTASQYYFENTDKDKTERKIKKKSILMSAHLSNKPNIGSIRAQEA